MSTHIKSSIQLWHMRSGTDHLEQLVTCLAADACLAADPGLASLLLAWSHTIVEIDHEIFSMVILLPSTDSRRVVVSYKRKYVHKVQSNCLVKLAQEKSVVMWTDRPNMTIVVKWDVKNQPKTHRPGDIDQTIYLL